ncbi:MAG: hypothetical protein ACREPP_08440 [Rhodanobacteraceae bacterium]
MKYLRALKAREEAQAECLFARRQLRSAAADAAEAYRAHPVPVLGAAAAVGFLSGRLRVGAGLIWSGARLAGAPALQMLRSQFGGF